LQNMEMMNAHIARCSLAFWMGIPALRWHAA
jgi:hypothetical protein